MEKPTKVFCYFTFCFFIVSFKAYSVVTDISGEERFTDCYSVFSSSGLDHEKYSETNLKIAMESSDYKTIAQTYTPLKRETTKKLFKLYKEQDNNRAFQVLFLSNIRFVYFVIGLLHTTKSNYNDLIQEGMIALLRAIRGFNLEQRIEFSTYARRAIINNVKRYEEQIGGPVRIRWTEEKRKIYHFVLEKMKESPSSNISESWIVEFLEKNPRISIKSIRHVLSFMKGSHVSLETARGDNSEFTLLDFIFDNKIDVERGVIYRSDLQQMRDWAMKAIRRRKKPAHYKVILKDRMFSENPRTVQDIANQFNLTRQAIQLAETSLKEMIRGHFKRYEVEYVNSKW